ncbi:polyamine ABC transporter substrate-binding protein [Candidatus Magnetaquicoccus inordinatus]|uniref:polyamine ABC transporter substrate-binding protein n=1 Tax=Candidatus Magnetaquicoccus inordinatus TaxID=2496818 RepID=UPI00102B27BE|nr:spermidine/putrescine ABC transporter substrate-binding protein [Candidatus Magnetaquicoccus inordinatus]
MNSTSGRSWGGLAGLLLLLALWFVLPQKGYSEELVLLNWEEYMDRGLLDAFEKESGIHVREVFFETEEARDALLAQTGGEGYDLVVVQAKDIQAYAHSGWLTPIPADKIPNMKHIGAKWRATYPEAEQYGVPWLWGTLGIGYRPDLLKREVSSWMDLLQPANELKGRIMMLSDAIGMRTIAMKALGYSMNDVNKKVLEGSADLLRKQKPFVHTYGYMGLGEKSPLITGQYWMALMFNGDAITLSKMEPNIAFVVPKEGTLLWVDCFTIAKASKKKEQAARLINFLHQPKNAARLAETVHFASVNEGALPFLSAEHRNNPIIYPPQEVMGRSEFPKNLPAKVINQFKSLHTELTNK